MELAKISDFNGRTIELMVTDKTQGKLGFIFPGRIITGIQKLVQILVVKMFTIPGSKVVDGVGTDLLESLLGSNLNISFLNLFLNLSLSQALNQMKEEQDADGVVLTDERISLAKISDIIPNTSTSEVEVRIFVQSEAGEDVTFILPLEAVIK